jgi:branched-chain amino acid transport system ATP-binding protein
MDKGKNMRLASAFGALAAIVLTSFMLPSDAYFFLLAAQCSIFALWATAYNVVYGYMGEISFGHAAYFGIGAYAVPLLMTHVHLPFLAAVIAGAAVAGVAALIVGTIIRGTRDIYFAISTFIFAQAVYILVLKWTDFTGGDNGLPVSRPDWLTSSLSYFIFCLVIGAAGILALYRIVNSPAGHVIIAARENERRARQIGYNTNNYRIAAFTASGLFSGLAGSLSSGLIFFVSPDVFFWHMSGHVIIMTIIGGAHIFFGPIIGAIFLVVFQDFVSGLSSSNATVVGIKIFLIGQHWPLLLGATFYAIILYEPNGIVGFVSRLSQLSPFRTKARDV